MYGKLLSTHLRYFSVDAFFEKKINYFHAVAEEMCERAQTIRWGAKCQKIDGIVYISDIIKMLCLLRRLFMFESARGKWENEKRKVHGK